MSENTESPRPGAFEKGVHPCVYQHCREYVAFDDEPYCFTHSPDSGSCVPGYSWEKAWFDAVATTRTEVDEMLVNFDDGTRQ